MLRLAHLRSTTRLMSHHCLPGRHPQAAGRQHVWLAGAHRAACCGHICRVLLRLRRHAGLQRLELLPPDAGLRHGLHRRQIWPQPRRHLCAHAVFLLGAPQHACQLPVVSDITVPSCTGARLQQLVWAAIQVWHSAVQPRPFALHPRLQRPMPGQRQIPLVRNPFPCCVHAQTS